MNDKRISVKNVKDKKLKQNLHRAQLNERIRRKAVSSITQFQPVQKPTLEFEENEHSLQLTQDNLKPLLSQKNADNIFSLPLDNFHYKMKYSKDGVDLLLGGEHGHLALLGWKNKTMKCELFLKDQINDICFINPGFFAVAQKNNTFIYDNSGLEIHHMDNINNPKLLDYLPYHFLMTSISRAGKLIYTDVSIGQTAAILKTGIFDVNLSA